MSEMVVRMAQAMIDCTTEACCKNDRQLALSGFGPDHHFIPAGTVLARAALVTLRDPTPHMLAAGWAKLREGRERIPFLLTPGPGLVEAHRAMIDEALR